MLPTAEPGEPVDVTGAGTTARGRRADDGLEAPEHLPISFLNALEYCPRRFYYEYAWGEMLTNEHVEAGRLRHQVADSGGTRVLDGAIKMRSVYVFSDRLRIAGIVNVVEAPLAEAEANPEVESLGEALSGAGVVYPVEYKKGSARGGGQNDHVQLCAQGLCLEERLGQPVAGGYLFSFQTQRRTWIPFTDELRTRTEEAIQRAYALLRAGVLPPPLPAVQERKCAACSLEPLCLPREVRALRGQP